MISLDWRTRSDAGVRDLDFAAFHEEELPALLAGAHGELVARALRFLDLPPLAFEVEGRSYTYRPEKGRIAIVAGSDDAAAIARLGREPFSDLVQELRSTVGLIIGDLVQMTRGKQQTLIEWEPLLRAALDGRPVYEPGSIQMRDRDGEALDLRRSFTLGDPAEEMAHFLAEAGFLLLRGVFTAGEMRRISDEIDRAAPTYRPDDRRSWWARTRGGDHRPVRLQYFHEHSPTICDLVRDPRYLAIGALTGDGHRAGQRLEGNFVEALIKPIDVVEGISDVTWHKDCSLGRHSYQCCGITTGISVTPSDPESGQLCVVAGSHRASLPLKGLRDDLDLPIVGLPSKPGDVSVHLSCTYHMSIPPKRAERRVLYTGFTLPPRAEDSAAARSRLDDIREAAPAKALRLKQTSIGDEPAADRAKGYDRSRMS